MSQTSKVNPQLRQDIITYLAVRPNRSISNTELTNFFFGYSPRSIQEATQKMTAEGTLVSTSRGSYSLNYQTTATATASAATASN